MNEKQIEISLAKLRKLWKQNKTQIGKQRICFIAKQLTKLQHGDLIPLTMKAEKHRNDEVQWLAGDEIQYFTPDFIHCCKVAAGLTSN